MFEYIRKLKPYFFSLREIDNNVSLDIKVPINWSYDEIIKPYRSIKTKIQDKNERFTLLSLIAVGTEEGYNVALTCALDIIVTNKEEEEKHKLFMSKVKELELLFKNQSLDKLKELNFISNNGEQETGQEDSTSINLVGQGIDEGFDRDSDSEEEDD